ncbi:MAG: adenylosuccinate lyase [Actinobacteria bacterium]|nr:adenylosuccinate lyase [Actinomycetota bacterium]
MIATRLRHALYTVGYVEDPVQPANVSPMLPRYLTPEMAELFSDRARVERWLQVELLAVDALAAIGRVPAEDAARIRRASPAVDDSLLAEIEAREQTTHHDVAAFVDVVSGRLGNDGRWFHFGLTSSDVVDTGLALALVAAGELVVEAGARLHRVLVSEARAHRAAAMPGRTHGMHALPVTFGSKLALLALQVARAVGRVGLATDGLRVGKLSGAVGTYAVVEPRVEAVVCEALQLRPEPASQVIARDRHADFVFSLALVMAAVENLATTVRLGHQTEVAELREGFSGEQKGSSAMPHKSNPVKAEQLCGLARYARSLMPAALENVALWHERDLTHSSVERIVLADACTVAHYSLCTATDLVSTWVVDTDRMSENLARSGDVVCSEALLHALIEIGRSRDEAYRTVQSVVRSAADNGTTLYTEAARLGVGLSDDELRATLDPAALLTHASRAVDAL